MYRFMRSMNKKIIIKRNSVLMALRYSFLPKFQRKQGRIFNRALSDKK